MILELLNKVAKENGWDDFSDVVLNSYYRITILGIVEKADELN